MNALNATVTDSLIVNSVMEMDVTSATDLGTTNAVSAAVPGTSMIATMTITRTAMGDTWSQGRWDSVDDYFCQYDDFQFCLDCRGAGWMTCFDCGGDYPESELCTTCHGDGELECEECNGTGENQ